MTQVVGFIGLGNMGRPMAANLTSAGYSVLGFDTAPAALGAAAQAGVAQAIDIVGAVQNADVVITMLPDGPIVKSVYEHVVKAARQGALLIDCSTIDVTLAREAHAMAAAAQLNSIDAPVSGGVAGAAAGTLTFMAGGAAAAFDAAKPLFEVMGQRAVHCGPAGAGQAAKICNNMILGVSMIGVCEAFALADGLGLDRAAMFDVVSSSSGSCWSISSYCPAPGIGPDSPADHGYQPGFAAALMLKDLALSQSAAHAAGIPTPLGAKGMELYQRFVEEGYAHLDFSAILPWLQKTGRGN